MKPWMQKSGIGLSGRIPVTTERKKSVAGNSAADSPIPERWSASDEILRLQQEKGTAESLVRDLARALQAVQWCILQGIDYYCPICMGRSTTGHGMSCDIGKALSRIPAHLRAPETTSTGESSTVLRQEGKP